MVNSKALIEAAIKALEKYYVENGSGQDIHYTFGYFDALAALKDFKKNAAVRQETRSRSDMIASKEAM